jgi:hypothetical protein
MPTTRMNSLGSLPSTSKSLAVSTLYSAPPAPTSIQKGHQDVCRSNSSGVMSGLAMGMDTPVLSHGIAFLLSNHQQWGCCHATWLSWWMWKVGMRVMVPVIFFFMLSLTHFSNPSQISLKQSFLSWLFLLRWPMSPHCQHTGSITTMFSWELLFHTPVLHSLLPSG